MTDPIRALCAERPSVDELGLIYHDCCRGCEFMDQVGFEDAALVVLARWGRPAPPAPPAEGEVAELARWLRLRNPIDMEGEPDDCTYFKLTRTAELLERLARQTLPQGMIPMEYVDADSSARIVSEPSEGGSGGCWVVRNSRHVNPCIEFSTAEAAWDALQRAHALPLPAPQGGEVEP